MFEISRPTAMFALLCLGCHPALAVNEASFDATSGRLTIPAVYLDSSNAYDVLLSISNAATYEFTVSSATKATAAGGASYGGGKLTVPSLTLTDSAGKVSRYAVELNYLTGTSPMRFKLASATQNTTNYTDSTEAAKVANWLRTVAPVDNDKSFAGVFDYVHTVAFDPATTAVITSGGIDAFYKDSTTLEAAKASIANRIKKVGPLLQASGVSMSRHVDHFPWGMLETSKGVDNWTMTDLLIPMQQQYDMDYVATVMPFNAYDLTAIAADSTCTSLINGGDYPYLVKDGKMGRVQNIDNYAAWLSRAVKRYDGDGKDDAPGLLRPVKYWQIYNEPEGPNCGGYRGDAASYVALLKKSYETIKAVCADCKILNGGAGLVDPAKVGSSFWSEVATAGGKSYIDIIALHYNEGKHQGTTDPTEFENWIGYIKSALGSDKPIWLTEFGIMLGSGTSGGFKTLTETQAAAWFMKFYAAGLGNGVTRFFSDQGAFADTNGRVFLPYYVNKLMHDKLAGFTSATRLGSGQYQFVVGSKAVYVTWNGVISALGSSSVTYYDMYGTEKTAVASSLAGSDTSPLILVK